MIKSLCLVVAVFGLGIAATAQEELNLERAIQLGLENNFDIQISELEYEIAENNNNWGTAGKYPTINFNAGQNNSIIQRKPANPFAVAGKNISSNVNGQLDVQFVLFDGYSIRLNKHRLEELQRLSAGNVSLLIENTTQAIILAYYAVLLDMERLNVLRRVMDFSRQQYEYVKLKKELGSAITFDVLNEQNNYLTDSANVLQQEVAYRNSVRNLNLLINQDLDTRYIFTDTLTFEEESYQYEDLRTRLMRSNTNLRNQYINRELARLATESARSALYPTITFNLGATGSLDQLNANFRTPTGEQIVNTVGYVNNDPSLPVLNSVNETALMRQTQRGHSYGASGNFGLRWTLFNGGQIRQAIENSRIQERMLDIDTEQLVRVLESDLMLAFDQYELRQQLFRMAEAKVAAAELNLDLAEERYRNGSISAIDLRIIQQNYRTAALEIYAAIYQALQTKVDLIRLTGGLLSEPETP